MTRQKQFLKNKVFTMLLAIMLACSFAIIGFPLLARATSGGLVGTANGTEVVANNANITYAALGDWTTPASSTSMQAAMWPGVARTATFKFTGTGFEVYGQKAADRAALTVTIDGKVYATYSCYSFAPQNSVALIKIHNLSKGEHTVVISADGTNVSQGDGYITQWTLLDSYKFYDSGNEAAQLDTPTTVASTEPSIAYTAEWSAAADADGNKNVSGWPGFPRTAQYEFTGTKIDIIGAVGADKTAHYTISIDGKIVSHYSAWASTANAKATLATIDGLSNSEHTILVSMEEQGKWFGLNGFKVYTAGTPDAKPEHIVKATSAINDAVAYNNADVAYESMPGKTNMIKKITYSFSGIGIGINLASEPGSDTNFTLKIDGKTVGVLDDIKVRRDVTEVYRTIRLQAGSHTVELINNDYEGNSGWIDFRGFNVYTSVDPTWNGTGKQTINDSDTNIYYSSQWVTKTEAGHINNDFHFTGNNVAATITYDFTGVGIEIFVQTQSSGGKFKVFINDVEKAIVDCTTTPYQKSQMVFRSERLAKGTHSVKMEKVMDGENKYVVFDAFKVIKLVEDIDYDADDYVYKAVKPSVDETLVVKTHKPTNLVVGTGFTEDGSAYVTSTDGSTLTYLFRGTGIEILANKGLDTGKFIVIIDDMVIGEVNTYSATAAANQKVFAAGGLKNIIHKVEIKHFKEKSIPSTGYNVRISGFNVIKLTDSALGEENVDYDADDFVLPTTGLILPAEYKKDEVSLNPKVGGEGLDSRFSVAGFGKDQVGKIYTGTAGSKVSFNFRGTGFELYADVNTGSAKAEIFVDGTKIAKVNFYKDPAAANALVFWTNSLVMDEHDVIINVIAEKSEASVDRYVTLTNVNLVVPIVDIDNSKKLDNTHYNVKQEGFGNASGSSYFNDTYFFSNAFGSFIEISFKGTGIKWYGSKNTNAGVVAVYIDGEEQSPVSFYSEVYEQCGLIYRVTGLENKNHTLKFVIDSRYNANQTNAFVGLDYVVVFDYSELAWDGFPSIPDDAPMGSDKDPVLPGLRPGDDTNFAELELKNQQEKSKGCSSSMSNTLGTVLVALGLLLGIIIAKRKRA